MLLHDKYEEYSELGTLLGNASYFTLGFTKILNEVGHFYPVKLFNPLMNMDRLLQTMTCT